MAATAIVLEVNILSSSIDLTLKLAIEARQPCFRSTADPIARAGYTG